nr:hypothetical protein [uncultured Catonella sp.]
MAQNKKEFNQIEYQNKYIKEKYDRVGLTMPKGKKEIIKARALEEGMSINEYINALIDKDIQANNKNNTPINNLSF